MRKLILYIIVAVSTLRAWAVTESEMLDTCAARFDRGQWLAALDGLLGMMDDTDAMEPEQRVEMFLLTGYIYTGYNDYVTAVRYYDAAYKTAVEADMPNLAVRAAANAAMSSTRLRNRREAMAYVGVVTTGAQVSPTPYNRFMARLVQGNFDRVFGNTEQGLKAYYDCLRMVDSGQVPQSRRINVLSELLDTYIQSGDVDSARHYLAQVEAEAARTRQLHVAVENNRYYADLYTRIGMKDSALIWQQRYLDMRDSLLNADNFMALSGRYTANRDTRQQMHIAGLNTKINYQTIALILAAAIIVLLGVAITVLRWQKNRLNSAYRALWQKNKTIEGLENEKRTESKVSTTDSDLCRRIDAYMESGMAWTDPDFSLQALAAAVESNTKYVSAAINDTHGVNFRTYINDYRIREARRRITDPDTIGQYSMQAIAESVGFRSSTNFIAAFKRQTGLTPSVYLKMWQDEQKNANFDTDS